jgi:AcrR family transcriptional regulator
MALARGPGPEGTEGADPQCTPVISSDIFSQDTHLPKEGRRCTIVKGETHVSSSGERGQIPDPRDRNLDARRRALAAGLVALLEHSDDLLTDGLHRKRLASISQQSRQTLYQHFPDHGAYLDEMIRVVLDPTDPAWATRDLTEYMDGIVQETGADSLGIVHRLAVNDFEALRTDEHWQLVVTVWALARHRPEVREHLGETWTYYNKRTAAALQVLLDHWQADLAPPFDIERAAHVFGALGEGLAMRATALDHIDPTVFADTIAAIAHAIVVPRGEVTSFEPALPQTLSGGAVPLDQTAVERVLVCALDRYASQANTPTFAELSRDSGLEETTLRAHFGDIERLITAVWDRLSADLARHHRDLDPRTPVLHRLEVQLERVLEMALSFPRLNSDLIRLSTTPSGSSGAAAGSRALLALSTPVEELLREARQVDAITFEVPPPLLATHLIGTAIGQAVAWPRPHAGRRPDARPILHVVWQLVMGPHQPARAPVPKP